MELKLRPDFSGGFRNLLLIVPYGIETADSRRHRRRHQAFNRTLWN